MDSIDRPRHAVNEREPMTKEQFRTTWSQLFDDIVIIPGHQHLDRAGDALALPTGQ